MANISAIKLPNGDIFDLVDEKSGYITAEIDPLFSASAAAGITSTDISNWNAKVSDDKTWNGVELDKTGTTQSSTSYIPARSNTSATTAYQLIATTEPYRYRVAKWDDNAYLYSTTPSANDNSTKVATTAYVDNAVGGISVPTKTSDLTNDSGFVTTDNKVLQETVSNDASYPVLLGYQVGTTNTTSKVHKSFSNFSFNPSTGSLKANKFNGLVLNSLATGFSISGGGTSKTLTINESYTLAGACAKAVDNSISTSSSSSNLPTSAAVASFVEGKGYITSYTETDPVFSASAAAGITATDISNWNNKVSDDKTWNGVTLAKQQGYSTVDYYVPYFSGLDTSVASLVKITTTPTGHRIPKYDSSAYLYSTTPSANDNSTKVATTAYVDSAVGGISVPTKTSDLTNDSGYITSAAIPALLSGTTLTVTPTQVKNALANNQNVEITHTDATFGSYKLYDFILSSTQDILCAPLIGQYGGNWFAFELLGNATNDTWSTLTTLLATASDLPTKTSDLTNDSGFVTTDTNTTYTLSNALSSHKFISTLTAGGSGSGTSTATMEFVAGTGITLTDDTTNKKITIASSVVNTDEKLKVTTISATGSQNFFVLSGNSDNSENKKRSTSALSYYLTSDNKSILTMGASNIMGQIQLIYGDSGGHKVTIQPSSMTGGGDKTITFPDATGTLALTSDIPPIPLIPTDLSDLNNDLNVSDFPNDAGYITGYTETDPIFTASAAYGISASDITNWNGKQAALVSGTNIKTINSQSLLGSGDITTQTIYASTVAPTSADGIDGDVWFIYTPSA